MQQTNVPFKVALGYIIVAIVLILAIGLVYRNTTTVLAINQATRDYIEKRQAADSTMSNLLKEEQTNLQQLTRAMQGKSSHNYLHEKMNSLNSGEDSVVVHSKAPKTHVAKNTTVEVMKTRKGFFRRLADAFKKEHAETLSIRRDSNQAVTDTLSTPVNVAGNVANILKQIDRKEKQSTRDNHEGHQPRGERPADNQCPPRPALLPAAQRYPPARTSVDAAGYQPGDAGAPESALADRSARHRSHRSRRHPRLLHLPRYAEGTHLPRESRRG